MSETLSQEMAAYKQHAHQLVDRLAPRQLHTVISFLQFMLMDPVSRAIAAAPIDDGILTPEAQRALHQANASVKQGEKCKSHEDLCRQLSL